MQIIKIKDRKDRKFYRALKYIDLNKFRPFEMLFVTAEIKFSVT